MDWEECHDGNMTFACRRGTHIWEEPSPETTQALRQKSLEEAARAYLGKARELGYSPVDAQQALQQ